MARTGEWPVCLVWPDVSTEQGACRARRIGASAMGCVCAAYAIAFLQVLSVRHLAVASEADGQACTAVLADLAAAAIAAAYLAIRLCEQRCHIAARVGLMWIGYETATALFAGREGEALLLLALLPAALQGIRGCPIQTDVTCEE